MARLTKKDITSHIKTSTGLTQAQSADAVNCVLNYIMKHVAAGDEVSITGFGTFSKVKAAPRTGTNPKTKEKIDIPATQRPKFKAGAVFKNAVADK